MNYIPMKLRAALFASLSVALTASASDAPPTFQSILDGALPACDAYLLPNSMARAPGFDLDKFRKDAEAELIRRGRLFQREGGEAFLRNASESGSDRYMKQCATLLLRFSKA